MEGFDRKSHWNNIYATKSLNEVSWYQPTPKTSLDLITSNCSSKDAKIIDVGGGDSFLVDHLLELGYSNITVLDISSNAIIRAQERLGQKADRVKWVESDITEFQTRETYDVWHDRAAFHFLVKSLEVEKYQSLINQSIEPNGLLILGTFSKNGPSKCSGIEIKQYSSSDLLAVAGSKFEKINCINIEHQTPFDTKQNFNFCAFRKTHK